MRNIWVAIVDDHDLFAGNLAMVLNNTRGISVVFLASNGVEFFEKLEKSEKVPDVVLMDIEMPKMDGLDATRKLKKTHPEIKVIIVTMHIEESYILYLLKLGADVYLFKNAKQRELEMAIQSVYDGDNYFNDKAHKATVKALKRKRIAKPNLAAVGGPLTTREIEVIKLICEGKTNTEIGEILYVSKRTIDSHRLKILRKTKAKNTAELIAFAVKNNLFSFDQ